MQNRALLRDVDLFAAEHGVNTVSQAGFFRELKQEFESFVGHAVLGIIEVQAQRFDRHALTALRVVCKKLPQMQL